jgi:cytochrome c oxidase subunit II
VQKWWSYLFGAMAIAATGLFIIAPFVGWWLPKNVSSFGGQVDGLFYLILAITGFFFILTEALLVYFMYTYAGHADGEEHTFGHHYGEERVLWTSFFKRIAKPVTAVIHNQHRLELFWTLIPAVILLYIAFAQISTWADIKYQSRMPNPGQLPLQMDVNARQFEWRVRYPSAARMASWKKQPNQEGYEDPDHFAHERHLDDVVLFNEVHTWKGQKVLVHLTSRDVLHSFYFPNMRLKQDAVPGKMIPVWFEATDYNTRRNDEANRWQDGYDPQTQRFGVSTQIWELACAELCGWGHYKMQGRLYVHEDEADYLNWLKSAEEEQQRTQLASR